MSLSAKKRATSIAIDNIVITLERARKEAKHICKNVVKKIKSDNFRKGDREKSNIAIEK